LKTEIHTVPTVRTKRAAFVAWDIWIGDNCWISAA